MNEGIHLDLDTWIVPGQIRKWMLTYLNSPPSPSHRPGRPRARASRLPSLLQRPGATEARGEGSSSLGACTMMYTRGCRYKGWGGGGGQLGLRRLGCVSWRGFGVCDYKGLQV